MCCTIFACFCRENGLRVWFPCKAVSKIPTKNLYVYQTDIETQPPWLLQWRFFEDDFDRLTWFLRKSHSHQKDQTTRKVASFWEDTEHTRSHHFSFGHQHRWMGWTGGGQGGRVRSREVTTWWWFYCWRRIWNPGRNYFFPKLRLPFKLSWANHGMAQELSIIQKRITGVWSGPKLLRTKQNIATHFETHTLSISNLDLYFWQAKSANSLLVV